MNIVFQFDEPHPFGPLRSHSVAHLAQMRMTRGAPLPVPEFGHYCDAQSNATLFSPAARTVSSQNDSDTEVGSEDGGSDEDGVDNWAMDISRD